jgi:hypothetical protein
VDIQQVLVELVLRLKANGHDRVDMIVNIDLKLGGTRKRRKAVEALGVAYSGK